jgi:hypothetical protein
MTHGPITKNVTSRALGLLQIRVGNSANNISTITPVLSAANSIGALADTKFNASAEFFMQYSGFPKRLDGTVPLSEEAALEGAYKEITPFNVALARGLNPTASVAAQALHDIVINSDAGTRDATKSIAVSGAGNWAVIDDEWIVVFRDPASSYAAIETGSIYGKKSGHVIDFDDLSAAIEPVDGDGDKLFSIPADFFTGDWIDGDTYVFGTLAGGDSAYADAHEGSIGLGGLVAPVDIRVEGLYTFPNGIYTMTFVFPRAQVSGNLEIAYAAEDEAAPPIVFNAQNASSDNVAGNAVWDNMPLGRIIWSRNA